MIRHYLIAALARIAKTPFTTLANVLTLALGLACFIAAYGIATYWRSGDTYHANADRTFLVGQAFTPLNQPKSNSVTRMSTAALGKYLPQDISGIERMARVYVEAKVSTAAGANKTLLNTAYAERDFLRIFDFDFIAGDPRSALDQPGSVVLTREAAERLFGDAPALGRQVLLSAKTDATVTGVIETVRQPSFMGAGPDASLRFDMLGHWNLSPTGARLDGRESWVSTQGYTFMVLAPGVSVDAFNRQMPAFVEQHVPPEERTAMRMEVQAYPINEVATRELDTLLLADNRLNLTAVMILLALGGLTLLVAAINYANLSTAQAAARAKEIGMRKTVGASRAAVMVQSWLETLIQSALALGGAVLILLAAAPMVRSVAGVDVLYFLSLGAAPWLMLAGLVLVVAAIAGAYPALALSGVRPVQALQSGRSRSGPKFVARVLVAIQFATASFLLIMLAVTQMQQAHLKKTALAVQEDPIVMLGDIRSVGVTYEALEAALSAEPSIKSMSVSDRPPWTSSLSMMVLARTPEEAVGPNTIPGLMKNVGYDYFETMGLKLKAGRLFDRKRDTVERTILGADPSQPIPAVIDENMSELIGFAAPEAAVDQIAYIPGAIMRMIPGGATAQPVHILGVIDTENMRLGAMRGMEKISYLYFFAPNSQLQRTSYPLVRIDRQNVSGALAAITKAWSRLSPNTPVDIQFFDDLFAQAYRQFNRISQLFILLASTAFAIASVGLLGIAVHVASRRRHEVAVRKTLGSSAGRVVRLLLSDFSKPVIIGNLIAWPLGYLAAQSYLAAFANRIDLTFAPFLLSTAITLAIAWVAVIGVVLKAASVRPAETLRHA